MSVTAIKVGSELYHRGCVPSAIPADERIEDTVDAADECANCGGALGTSNGDVDEEEADNDKEDD